MVRKTTTTCLQWENRKLPRKPFQPSTLHRRDSSCLGCWTPPLLWHARVFQNPSDCDRPPVGNKDVRGVDSMHYWCRTLAESFLTARQC